MMRPKIFIAVMGVTGAGKSTFIKTASELDDIEVGHQLHSCTSQVTPYTFEHKGYDVVLIDTPGFNDTHRSETDVLKEIADWLDATYRNPPNIKLTGIIYLHSITDQRMLGSALRNLKMFRKLCGDHPLKNVVLVTTFWGKETQKRAEEREEQLRTDPDFWLPMIQRGSRLERFTDRDSALEIILSLAKQDPVVLRIQQELVDQNKTLLETEAGHAVDEELRKLEEQHRNAMKKLHEDMESALAARDEELQEVLEESKRKMEMKLERVQAEQDKLRYERRNEHRRMQDEIESARFAVRRQLSEEKQRSEKDRKVHQRQLEEHRIKSQKERDADRREFEMRLEAQRVEDRMHFDEIVTQLRANEDRLRAEERDYLEQQILELQEQPKKSGRGKELLIGLGEMLGRVAMSALGFPSLMGGSAIMDLLSGGD